MHASSLSPPSAGPRARALPGVDGWEFHRFRRPADFAGWPAAPARSDGRWMEAETLAFLSGHPQGFSTEGVCLRHPASGQRLLLTAQTFRFRVRQHVRHAAGGRVSRWDLRRRLLGLGSARVLCLGQLLTSGDYAYAAKGLSPELLTRLLLATADVLAGPTCGYRAVVIKDLGPPGAPEGLLLQDSGFLSLPADPVMHLDLTPFATPEDYLDRLSSKYRVRYRRARGKLGELVRRRLSPEEVGHYLPRLYALYLETSRGADVNVVHLQPDYFGWLGRSGQLHAYFTPDAELVGFTSGLPNGPVYQAHFLGLEEAYKYSHHLYHNMLYDLLEDAIRSGYDRLDYGRTALEIKSSVGAEPRYYDSWLRIHPQWLNPFVPAFLSAVFTPPAWEARNPFKGR
ncbi:GNAT family N-acetyltransferase [Lewinella sp. IMCC34183]|uniref:GNAT family N-acetyltransferase n=1 Tax=Lewinella sp. IMCC34183 TaxID=2248762 RepID=UPI000E25D100|nr:GNAT family N-acetyltransferase [Lewinella sp. IMCC34183]